MAEKKKIPITQVGQAEDKKKALETALAQIEKNYGKGAIMRLGDIADKMKQRSKYRRNRHNRKTRYRKARWLNRKNSIKTVRFSPTMTSKFHGHVKEIEYIKSILPITQMILETGQFDMHLMKDLKIAKQFLNAQI